MGIILNSPNTVAFRIWWKMEWDVETKKVSVRDELGRPSNSTLRFDGGSRRIK